MRSVPQDIFLNYSLKSLSFSLSFCKQLKKPIEGMEILNLPDRDLNITENTSVRVFAYARPHMAKYGLKWMNLKTISDKDCEEYHFGSPSQMCAGDIYTNGVCSV